MMTLSIVLTAAIRIVLVLLFFPFSALDKILNFRGAVAQAHEASRSKAVAVGLIVVGLAVEVFMSLGVVTGLADRACAFVLAGYCGVTALLWKQFWKPGDFWASNTGTRKNIILGFPEEFCGRCRVPADSFWNRCPLGPARSYASFGVVPAVSNERRAATGMNIDIVGTSQTILRSG